MKNPITSRALGQGQSSQVVGHHFGGERLNIFPERLGKPVEDVGQLLAAQVGFAVRLGLFGQQRDGVQHSDAGQLNIMLLQPVADGLLRGRPAP